MAKRASMDMAGLDGKLPDRPNPDALRSFHSPTVEELAVAKEGRLFKLATNLLRGSTWKEYYFALPSSSKSLMFYDTSNTTGQSRGTIDLAGATLTSNFREEEDKSYKGHSKLMFAVTLGKSVNIFRAPNETELAQWKSIISSRLIVMKEKESFREGYLAIRNKAKKWKDRYCVLHVSGKFLYYKTKQMKKPSYEILLTSSTQIKALPEARPGAFCIQTDTEALVCIAVDDADKELWMTSFRQIISDKAESKSGSSALVFSDSELPVLSVRGMGSWIDWQPHPVKIAKLGVAIFKDGVQSDSTPPLVTFPSASLYVADVDLLAADIILSCTSSGRVIQIRFPSASAKVVWLKRLWGVVGKQKIFSVKTLGGLVKQFQVASNAPTTTTTTSTTTTTTTSTALVPSSGATFSVTAFWPKQVEARIWARPAFLGHFCDAYSPIDMGVVTAPSLMLDLLSVLSSATHDHRPFLSLLKNEQVTKVSDLQQNLRLMLELEEEARVIRANNFVGMAGFLSRFVARIEALKPQQTVVWRHGPSLMFSVKREPPPSIGFEFLVVTTAAANLAYHPYSLSQWPKTKYLPVRVANILPQKVLNPGLWFLLFSNNEVPPTVVYELLVPFLAEVNEEVTEMKTVLRRDATVKQTPLPVLNGPEESQSQPRSDKHVMYRMFLSGLRCLVRGLGLDTVQQKQVFVVLRLAYLFKIGDDLSKQAKISSVDKLLINTCCDQTFRAASKLKLLTDHIDDSYLGKVRSAIVSLRNQLDAKYAANLDNSKNFDLTQTAPFRSFTGFDCLEGTRDNDHLSGGSTGFVAEVFTNLKMPSSAVTSLASVFDQIQQCRSRCNVMMDKISLSSLTIVNHQICAFVEHSFTALLPLPSARGTPAAIFKCPYSTAKDITLVQQRTALRCLLDIAFCYASASLSTAQSNSQHRSTRMITGLCILAIFDAMLRIQASPKASPISRAWCSRTPMSKVITLDFGFTCSALINASNEQLSPTRTYCLPMMLPCAILHAVKKHKLLRFLCGLLKPLKPK